MKNGAKADLKTWLDSSSFERRNIEDTIRKIVKRWLTVGNTLNGLFDKICEEVVQDDSKPLCKQYEDLYLKAFNRYKEIISDTLQKLSEEYPRDLLLLAVKKTRAGSSQIPRPQNLPLFEIPEIAGGFVNRIRALALLGRYWSNKTFWGEKGNTILDAHRIECLNNKYGDDWWVSRILDEPWNLWKEIFSQTAISERCISYCWELYSKSVEKHIEEKLRGIERELEDISTKKQDAMRALENSKQRIEKLEGEKRTLEDKKTKVAEWASEWAQLEKGVL